MARRLSRALQSMLDPVFVVWNAQVGEYVYPRDDEYRQLSAFNGPVVPASARVSSASGVPLRLGESDVIMEARSAWLVLVETVYESEAVRMRAEAARLGMRVAAVFYDAIPVVRPDLCLDAAIRENHADYMSGLAACDLVLPISQESARCLTQYWSDAGIAGTKVVTEPLPGEFGGAPRVRGSREARDGDPGSVRMLCVSTLEPRKNHRTLLEAVRRFARAHPEVDWTLTLVGNRYAGGEPIALEVEKASRDDSRIRWVGVVDDDELHALYRDCSFTVYASEIEGFGLPIMESLWHARPCICHREGVMAELARPGGCLMVDVRDADALATAMARLAGDAVLRARLSGEAGAREIRGWTGYASAVRSRLAGHELAEPLPAGPFRPQAAGSLDAVSSAERSLQEILYPGCLTERWQMSDSERLALTAVLHRHMPKVAIEVGTYCAGSLSLLSQYASAIFSIDIDPEVATRYSDFTNVSFLTGTSQLVLPMLLEELNRQGMPVEFVLIDGDHSTEGVRADIEAVLAYVPTAPLLVMIHDGFNPECRRGMQQANWAGSPYVKWVDLDFVPGRVVEHGGSGTGEQWGGLALAYFSPGKRSGSPRIEASAQRTFDVIRDLGCTPWRSLHRDA